MASPVPEILLTNTFDEWRIAFNSILDGGPLDTDNIFVDSTNKRIGFFQPIPLGSLHIKTPLPSIVLEDSSNNTVTRLTYDTNSFFISADESNSASNSGIEFLVDGVSIGRLTKDKWDIKKPIYLNGVQIEDVLEVEADNILYSTGKLSVEGNLSYTGTLSKNGNPVPSSEFSYLNTGTGAIQRTIQERLRDRTSFMDYGALGDGSTNDYTAILNAMKSGKSVLDGEGKTFKFNTQINLLHSELPSSLRIQNAIFDMSSMSSGSIGFMFSGASLASTGITSNVASGDSSISVTSSTGFVVGDSIYIGAKTTISDVSGTLGKKGEFAVIKKIVGNTLYIASPFVFNYTTSDTVYRYSWIKDIVFENCTFIGALSYPISALGFLYSQNIVVNNCVFQNVIGNCISIEGGTNIDIYGCSFNTKTESGSGNNCAFYAISPFYDIEVHSNTSYNQKSFCQIGLGTEGVGRWVKIHDNHVSGFTVRSINIFPQVAEHIITNNTLISSSVSGSTSGLYTSGLRGIISNNIMSMYNGGDINWTTYYTNLSTTIHGYIEIEGNNITHSASPTTDFIRFDIQDSFGSGNLNIRHVKINKNVFRGSARSFLRSNFSKTGTYVKCLQINENSCLNPLLDNALHVISNLASIENVSVSLNLLESPNGSNSVLYFNNSGGSPGYIKNGIISNNILKNGSNSIRLESCNNFYSAGNNITTTSSSDIRYQSSSTNVVFGSDVVNGILQGNTNEILIVEERQTSGTVGGSITPSTWNVRGLNTIINNTIVGANLVSSVITLPAGTYDVSASSTFCNCVKPRLRFANSLLSIVLYGPSSHSYLGTEGGGFTGLDGGIVECAGRIVLTETTNFNLGMWTTGSNAGTSAKGSPTGATGIQEVYSQVIIKRVG